MENILLLFFEVACYDTLNRVLFTVLTNNILVILPIFYFFSYV